MKTVRHVSALSAVKKTPKPKPVILAPREVVKIEPKLEGDPGTDLSDYKLDLMKLD